MRVTIALLCLFTAFSAVAQTAEPAAGALLQRGITNFRSASYASAITDLQSASRQLLGQQQMREYVDTGTLPTLPEYETALVYLALAQSRLGRDEDARNTVLQLMTAERIRPTYATLQLESDARDFELLAATLVPNYALPANTRLASGTAPPPAAEPLAPVQPKVADAPQPVPPAPTTGQAMPVQPTIAEQRAERQRVIDALVAQERIRIEREAAEKIAAIEKNAGEKVSAAEQTAQQRIAAAEQAANQRAATAEQQSAEKATAAQREAAAKTVAAEREAAEKTTAAQRETAEKTAAAQRDADAQIAAAQKAAAERVAAERAAIQRAADERIAAERNAAEKLAQERIAAERVAAEKAAQERVASELAERRRTHLTAIRQADAYAANEKLDQANEIYGRIAASDAPREYVAAAAVGLYRTGNYRNAVQAFRRLAPYARGEEDLRYYHAVSLYENGDYSEAKKELACALPFIQLTDDVSRYRAKIEGTTQRASR